MAQAFLTKDNFKEKWESSKSWMEPLFAPLSEYERIARNRPHPNINKAYPKNTDGTLSAINQEFGKRIVQQVPSGKVETNKDAIHDIVADYVLTKDIIPNANTQADVLQKSWGVINKGLTFGSIYTMTFFSQHNDYFGADFRLFYIKDGYQEAGKTTFYENNYYFVRAWYQDSDIDSIIAREEALKAEAKELGIPYEKTWDIAALKRAKEWKAEKETGQLSAAEKERNMRSEAIEIVHGFQNGVGAKFFSYIPGADEFVKEKPNEDPRGVMPIQALYCEIDFENPLGRGIIERSGGTQNVIDSMLQTYQWNRALSLAPPLVKRGNWNKTQAKLVPNAVIDLGSGADNSLDALKLDTTALANFAQDYGLFKSQIIAMNNNGDTSISSEVGNPGFSKTQAGVEAQQLKLGISDNYMRKQYERWFKEVCESMLNIHFANKHGVEIIQLDKETASKIRKINESLVDEEGNFEIDYDDFTEAITFEVDASTSDKASKQAQLEAMDSFWERAASNPFIQQILQQYPEKAVEAYNQYLALTGVEDQEKLQIDMEQFKEDQMAMQEAEQEAMMAAQEQEPAIEGEVLEGEPMPAEELLPEELPVEEMAPEEVTDEDLLEFGMALKEQGYEEDEIANALTMMENGVPDEEIAEILAMAREEAV